MRTSRILVLVLVAGALTGGPAEAAGESCRGRVATMVGEPGGTVTGTDGDDVIVTNGASVEAGGGADTICVTGGYAYLVDAGDGDDVVDTTALRDLQDHARIVLGAGADTFDGGTGRDTVTTGTDVSSADGVVDADTDRVTTGRGHDSVYTGQRLVPDHDDVDLGRGNDHLYLRSDHNDGTLDGGPAANRLLLELQAGTWSVDDRAGELRQDGVAVSRWTRLGVRSIDGGSGVHVRYAGSPGDDYVYVNTHLIGSDLGAGDDFLLFGLDGPAGRELAGGPGHDSLSVFGATSVDLDLRRHRVAHSADGDGYRLSGFEYHRAAADRVRMIGGPRADELGYDGCEVHVRGNRGGDDLHWTYGARSCGSRSHFRVEGGRGDDRLTGSGFRDHLDGGAGHDVVRGRGAVDWCRGEVRRGCELP